jgi:hypothetical protein
MPLEGWVFTRSSGSMVASMTHKGGHDRPTTTATRTAAQDLETGHSRVRVLMARWRRKQSSVWRRRNHYQ